MDTKKELDHLLDYLTAGSPAADTLKNILKTTSGCLLSAMEEIIKQNWSKKKKKIPEDILYSATVVTKNIFKDIKNQTEEEKKAITLLFSLSKNKNTLNDDVKLIVSNEYIWPENKLEALKKQLEFYPISKSLQLLVECYTTTTRDPRISWNIEDLIYNHLKNKAHSLHSVRSALSAIREQMNMSEIIEIILLRGIDNLSGFKKPLKKKLTDFLSKNFSLYWDVYLSILAKDKNHDFIDLIFSFDDDALSRLLISIIYQTDKQETLVDYIKAHETKEFAAKIFAIFVKNLGTAPTYLMEKLLFSFSIFWIDQLLPYMNSKDGSIQEILVRLLRGIRKMPHPIRWVDQLLPYIDHENISIQIEILGLLKDVQDISRENDIVKKTIRNKIKSKVDSIKNIAIEILEQHEHQKALLPILSIINRKNWDEIDALDLSILDQVANSHVIPFNPKFFLETTNRFPFTLTQDQKAASEEIIHDMWGNERMYRLLQGDVGSGKTEVILLNMAHVIAQQKQCAFLCPTQILATQQFEKCKNFFPPETSIALLTGATSPEKRKQIIADIKTGKTSILIWTHSILDDTMAFKNLALSVIDEQHKFWVIQRSKILRQNCHALEISATPIPRSLSLKEHGLIDITSIKQLPAWRKQPKTSVIHSWERNILMENINERLHAWEQIYRVCKTITSPNYTSVHDIYQELLQKFPTHRLWILHGDKSAKTNQHTLNEFIAGKIDILISTTMIESGLDIPNAKSIVIENAETYWLSQLHQMRWRVSRDSRQWFCYLCTDVLEKETDHDDYRWIRKVDYRTIDTSTGQKIQSSKKKNETISLQKKKIQTLLDCFDGYEIAEIDLELSGWGDIKGIRQRGK